MPITLPARIITATGVMEGEMENVSLRGAFIRCQKPLEPGERLMVVVKLPSNPLFNSHAEVVWSRVPRADDELIGRGMGVKFIDLTQTSLILEAHPPEQMAEARL
jgi:Tfp pilus assembly protein PilZ